MKESPCPSGCSSRPGILFEEGDRPSRYGVAGGAPGVSTVSITDQDLGATVIVLSNCDEPLGEKIGQAIFKMLGNN